MKNMKRSILVLLVLSMVCGLCAFSLSACNNAESSNGGVKEETLEDKAADEIKYWIIADKRLKGSTSFSISNLRVTKLEQTAENEYIAYGRYSTSYSGGTTNFTAKLTYFSSTDSFVVRKVE